MVPPVAAVASPATTIETTPHIGALRELERKVVWLSSWIIHNANHIRETKDGVKVGGHQASSASLATLMTALYFHALRPQDRVAVKPHASPVFHAIQYLFGRQTQDQMARFRGFGGAQPYPSRTKDEDDVDFSTGSVGLGGAMTVFASLTQDYLRLHGLEHEDWSHDGRMIALFGDAELDEGVVFETLLESWKHDVRNCWWIIDYNRQSLDSVVTDRLFNRLDGLFSSMNWDVQTIKYGKLLQAQAPRPGGEALLDWIDSCPNQLYSALTFKGAAAWREHLRRDLGDTAGIKALLDDHDDDALHALMTNLAGHDLETVLEAYAKAAESDRPQAIIAYTVKGKGLPLEGHKDNHSGLMTSEQMAHFKAMNAIGDGEEWERFAGLNLAPGVLQAAIDAAPFAADVRRRFAAPRVAVPDSLEVSVKETASTQEAFGRILNDIGRGDSALARRLITTSPDVTVSTNLGGWVNQRQIFDRHERADIFRAEQVVSAQRWTASPTGQHIELGIAENNLFLTLAALGLSAEMFGTRLLPIGALYDPFIARGQDAMVYACYQDARFMLIGTPSGITLAPEGGAHQSLGTPPMGIAQPNLTYFEPAFVDELSTIMRWSFDHIQDDDGGSVYLRLSTRSIAQPKREMDASAVLDGAYWQVAPELGTEIAIIYCGAVVPQVVEAHAAITEDIPGVGLLAVPSADRLYRGWAEARRGRQSGESTVVAPIERLLADLAPNAALVTVLDGHPSTLAWLGSVAGHRVQPLGVSSFGESGNLSDLYRVHGVDKDAIIDAAAQACLSRL